MIMKALFKPLYLGIVLVIMFTSANAQGGSSETASSKPAWLPENGYWVVESNLKTPKHSIVYFYTDDDTLIYKEELNGVKLNPKKDQTKMKLKKLLESALWAWNAKKPINETAKIVNLTFSH